MYTKKTYPLDKKISSDSSYKKLIKNILGDMFRLKTDAKRIYIDLNSCLSILFREEDINNEEIIDEVGINLERFLQLYIADKVEVIILFTLEPSQAHIDTFPEWCKERYQRVDFMKSNFLPKLIQGLKEFSEKNSLIKVANTHKVHPALVVYCSEIKTRKKFAVLSKDVIFQCLPLNHMIIFTGRYYIDMSDRSRPMPDDVDLPEPTSLFLPVYLSIRGDSRNEYPGVKGFGFRNTMKYITEHKLRIKSNLEHPEHHLKETIDKYSALYDINKLMAINKETVKIIS